MQFPKDRLKMFEVKNLGVSLHLFFLTLLFLKAWRSLRAGLIAQGEAVTLAEAADVYWGQSSSLQCPQMPTQGEGQPGDFVGRGHLTQENQW